MLHDIGSLVIHKKFPDQAGQILEHCKNNNENLFNVELKIFGATHAIVGGELRRGRRLSSLLYEPVYYRHRPRKSKDHSLGTKIIHVADCMVDEMKLGASGEAIPNLVRPKILKGLGFGELPIEKFEEDIKGQLDTALSVFL